MLQDDLLFFLIFVHVFIVKIMIEEHILKRSEVLPVLVDFWAPWCGPCRVLSPLLDDLAAEARGRWELFKVNTDEHTELMHKYRIQGIPSLKMFFNRQIIGEKTGALPRHELLRWIDEIIPTEEKKEWNALISDRSTLDHEEFIKRLTTFIEKYPQHQEARKMWLSACMWKDVSQAKAKLQKWSDLASDLELVSDLTALAELYEGERSDSPLTDGLLIKAAHALKAQNTEIALQKLIEAISLDKEAYQQLARRVCIAIFHHLGEDHPLTRTYRRRFSMALY